MKLKNFVRKVKISLLFSMHKVHLMSLKFLQGSLILLLLAHRQDYQ